MRVFVSGASGYIGSAVAAEMARSGHEVLGLVRSAERGSAIARREVRPVVGTMQDSEAWIATARECQVLIHCAAEYSPEAPKLDDGVISAMIEAASVGRPRLIIYTSGCWVHGNTGPAAVDEASPLNPFDVVAWRPEHEDRVLHADRGPLRTMVLRPGCVYGGRGGLTAAWFSSAAQNGAARVIGD